MMVGLYMLFSIFYHFLVLTSAIRVGLDGIVEVSMVNSSNSSFGGFGDLESSLLVNDLVIFVGT